ncbi:hypothetical protein M8C21_032808 [Ambrosia artemisiifolia]|uniref:Uncharacterized protein n=1 Tax=Ambrosia artemisiifolia TaxID=4212 RepID=A0AAD5GMY6_AMBAR|nr:hypothetical protein M8C21_032808 [Ambrosia artemisiifolia]
MSIIEKGIWDDVFPIEGGGLVHMKLQFFLSEEDRNRIRLMRESAVKKKQAEILGSIHENVIDKREETTFPRMIQEIEQKIKSSDNLVEKLYDETLKEKTPNDVNETNKESALNKNNAILLQQAEVPEKLLEDTKTRGYLKNNNAVKSEPLYNRVEKFPRLAKETEVNTIKDNEIQREETELLKRLHDSSSSDVGSSRLNVVEKMKSFSHKLAGKMGKRSSLEKLPQNIKKMISVFESTTPQDRVPLKPVSAESYRFGTSRVLKDYYQKSSSLKDSEDSSLSRLRSSFSTGDLRENLLNITTEGNQADVENTFVEPSECIHSNGNDPKGADIIGKESVNDEENLPKSPHEGGNDAKESIDGRKISKFNLDYLNQDGSGQWTFLDEKRHFCLTAEGDKAIHLFEGKGHRETVADSIPETVVKDEEMESPESADVEASNGSFGQAMKIALVVGFGALVFLFRQRESGKGKSNENKHTLRNQVFMNRRGSIEEQGRRFGVSR